MINRGGRRVKLVHPTETTIHINTAIRARLKEREKGLRNRISREEETTPFLRSLPSLFRITELREKKRKERKGEEESRFSCVERRVPANYYRKAEASLRIMSGRCWDRVAAWEEGTDASSFLLSHQPPHDFVQL